MTLFVRARPILALLALATLAAGCSKKKPEAVPDPVSRDQPPPPPPPADRPSVGGDAGTPVGLDASRRAEIARMIHFEYDRFDLTAEARQILTAKAAVLRELPGVRIRVEGHADERGSDEYNLVLSNQRAASTKRFLVEQGISADRIDVIGFGEERPLVRRADEAAWAQNRRAEFPITAEM